MNFILFRGLHTRLHRELRDIRFPYSRSFKRVALATILTSLLFLSCHKFHSPKLQKSQIIAETGSNVTYADAFSDIAVIPKKPSRVIPLSSSYLDIWYLAGGTAIARAQGNIKVPPAARDLPVVGSIATPNLERIISLNPDFVILGSFGAHRKIKPVLIQNSIPVVSVNYYTYQDFLSLFDFFIRLTGKTEIYETVYKPLDREVRNIIKKCPKEENPEVLIIFNNTTSIECQTENGLIGDMVKLLGGKNAAARSPVKNSTTININLEKLLVWNPDVIFVTFHGNIDKCLERLEKEFINQPTWQELKAVKNKRVHYLPKELFLYRPNGDYPRAFRILASFLYPDNFKKVDSL